MRAVLVPFLLVFAAPALAAWPSDVSVSSLAANSPAGSGMNDFRDLSRELGAGLSSFPALPANTTGIDGFEVAAGNTFWFIDAYNDDQPTEWQSSHPNGEPPSFQMSPSLVIRKGLPLSTEIGMATSWFAGSGQGAISGFARAALLEGHLPWPSVAVQAGYTGYIGNDELRLGVVDLSATLGTSVPFKRSTHVTQSHFSPFFTVGLLRIRAQPVVDQAALDNASIVAIGGPDANSESQLTSIRLQSGFQVNSGAALLRMNASWTPSASLLFSASAGVGF